MTLPNQAKRRIIPRWRSFDETAATLELVSNGQGEPKLVVDQPDPFLAQKLLEWEIEPSVGLAVDILSSAVVLGKAQEFEATGWWILTRPESGSLSLAVLDLARLCASGAAADLPRAHRQAIHAHAFLRRCRGLLESNPLDSVLRVDTALALSMMGNVEKAEKQMKAAVQLAPDNRFVLRSAARFWVHRRDPEQARDILIRSARTGFDPWLIASEISIAGLARKSPKFFGRARVILHDRKGLPYQLSELAGTMGTVEALDGTKRHARNFFEQSLVDPTENAVAQAVWAASERILPGFDAEQFKHLQPAEADAWQARSAMNWDAAIKACYTWGDLEPFSMHPFQMGSFISSMVDRYEDTKQFCMAGLKSNPRNFNFRNNSAVARLFQGEVEEPLAEILSIKSLARSEQELAVWRATTGLALLCSGEVEAGRDAYRSAIENAVKAGQRDTACFAAAYWVKAEIANKQSPALALEAFRQNSQAGQGPELQYFKDRFRAMADSSAAELADPQK